MHLINILSNIICETLLDPDVIQKARRLPHAFTRNNGKLPYLTVVKMLLENRKLTISAMLDEFFLELWKMSANGVQEPGSCTQQAFSKARAGIDHSIFETCFQRMLDFLCDIESLSYCKRIGGLWGVQLIAIDGSRIPLPNRKFLLEKYGGSGRDASSPTALASIAYDMLNNRILDAQLEPQCVGERTLAIRHMDNIRNRHRTDLLYTMFVFDRGYASKNLILFIEDDMHCRYLFRLRDKFNLEIDALPAPDSKEGVADHTISLYEGHRVRVIKFYLPSGILETLITNDFEMEAGKFRQIYFYRWSVEEAYKLVKEKTGLTNFKGWAENSIKQEFWVTMLLANLSLAIKKETDGIVKHEQQSNGSTDNKHLYQTNMNELIGAISRRFSMYVDAYADGADVRTRQTVVKSIFSFAISHRVIDRKGTGESNPRKEPRKVKHHCNVKQTH